MDSEIRETSAWKRDEVMSEQYYDDTLWEVQDRYLIIFNIFFVHLLYDPVLFFLNEKIKRKSYILRFL